MIFPAHGHGSPCGADIGDRLQSTIGYERKFNPFLQFADLEKFKEHALSTAPPVPKYYPRMKKVNAKGPEILGNLPRVPGLPPKTFQEAVEEKAGVLVDTRMMLAFGGGHIAGALNIGGSPMLSIWAGWLLDPDEPILLVLNEDSELDEIVQALHPHWLHEVRRLPRRRDESVGQRRVSARGSRPDDRARDEERG